MHKMLQITTRRAYKIFFDPLRQDILKAMRQIGDPCTVKEISTRIAIPHAKVHYHVQQLLDLDALQIDHEVQINGIIAKYYALNFSDVNVDLGDQWHSQDQSQDQDQSNRAKGSTEANTSTNTSTEANDPVLDQIKKLSDDNVSALGDSYGLLIQRVRDKKEVYGIHVHHETVYLTHEDRKALNSIILAYLSAHAKCPQDLTGMVKTRIFATIYDEEYE